MVASSTAVQADAILQLLPHGVVVVAPDWRVVLVNAEATRLLGGGCGTLWERCPDLEHTAFASAFRYAMADRTELLTESALPTVGWCQARALPTPDGGLLISLRQVHGHTIERGQAMQALLLGEIGDALTREESLGAALQRCAVSMRRNLDVTIARIWVTDVTEEYLDLTAHAGLDMAERQDKLALGQHAIGRIGDTGEPYLTNDVATDTHVGATPWMRAQRLVSFAGYPLRVEDRVVGVMAMYARRPIDHDMLNSLSTIASAIALGIARNRADAARRRAETLLRAQADRLEQLHELGKQLSAELELQPLAAKVTATAQQLCGATSGAFVADCQVTRMLRFDAAASDPSYTNLAGVLPHHGAPIESVLALPIMGRNGRQLGTLVFGHERAAQFTAESERLVASVASTAAIAMDNARLFAEARELIKALEKSNAELDQFAYIASHDLKAPLRGIANLSQWIEDDLGDRLDDQTRNHLGLLRGRVLRLENLIAGILAYSRAGRARDPKRALVALDQLAREVCELLAPPATAKIVVGELPQLWGIRVQLQQVLLNLVSNALDYNRERDLTITLSARREGACWEIVVADDGVGIPPEFHARIWGLFQTLERRDKVESTGIGLSVVRKIVEANHGRTWVETNPGGGARFLFTWPAEPEGARRG